MLCQAATLYLRKKTAWKSLPELTYALLMPASGTKEIPDDAMNIIERFVILLFDRTSTCSKVDHARRKLFPRKKLAAANLTDPSTPREQSTRVVTSGKRQ